MPITLGNDVAKYQGNINFDTLKANTQFLIIKATEGVGYKDPKLDEYKKGSRDAGILTGFYHFARPELGNSAIAEADYFLKTIVDLRDGELLALDFEVGFSKAVEWSKQFLDRIREKCNGYNALIYMDQSRVSQYNWKPVVDDGNGLWIAAYTYDPNKNDFKKGAWGFAAMQQWSNSQNVPGIPAKVDGNVFFGDLNTLKKYTYKAPVTPQPTPTPTPNPTPPTMNDQTKYDFGGDIGVQEMGAIRSIINDLRRDKENLNNELNTVSGKLSSAKEYMKNL